MTGLTEHNLRFKLNGVKPGNDNLLIIKNDSIVLNNEVPENTEINAIKGKVTEIIPSEFGFEVTIDAGDIFYVNILHMDLAKLNLIENREVWVSFPINDIVVINGN
jgi:molybdopterin-binding protein